MAGVPNSLAARGGVLGDTGAADQSAQINQFLGAHGVTAIYQGNPVLTPTTGRGNGAQDSAGYWTNRLDAYDFDQPFTAASNSIGRVEIPLLPVGTGADLAVTLAQDSSGGPGAPIASVRIPATWITSFASVAGAAGPDTAVQLVATGNPLAVPAFNSLMFGLGFSAPWASPASSGMGTASNPSSTTSGNYFIQIGGWQSGTSGPVVANVFTINWSGGTTLQPATPQPSLPQALSQAAVAATADTLIAAGGNNASGVVSSVYTAGWNPITGTVSSWSQQASLPQGLQAAWAASWGQTVYVVGGQNSGGTPLNTVYWATVTNGQLQNWNTATMPVAVNGPMVAVVGNYLIVAGGFTTYPTVTSAAVNYAPINPDGSLGAWRTAPSLPTAVGQVGNDIVATSTGIVIIGGYTGSGYSTAIQSLAFGPAGPGEWQTLGHGSTADSGIFPVGAGQSRVFSFNANPLVYFYADAFTTPRISVPLPGFGVMTIGNTYHIVMQQIGGDLNNYLRTPVQTSGVFPGSPTYLARPRGTSTWAAQTSGSAIPISIYDQTAVGPPWHLSADNGARISTLVYNTTPDASLIGVAEATAQPAPVLNQTPVFTAGLGGWTGTGGSLTQSATFTNGGLPFSAKLTPTGSAATSSLESEQNTIIQGHAYTVTAWLYSPTGYSQVALSINWYNASHTFISSTSGGTTALAAGTWTKFATSSSTIIPATAAYATIAIAESGTPPATAVLYVATATLQDASGPMLASVTQINYASTAPGPPTGVTVLA